jgi:tetratricopeptide (TPR) repeat protein
MATTRKSPRGHVRPATPPLMNDSIVERKDDPGARELGVSILEELLASAHRPVPRPVLAHSQRVPSGERGVSLMCLQAIRAFYEQRDGLGKMMADICKEEGFSANVCALTASTGLSLAESVSRHESDTSTLVGPATTFFSYSWTGTALGDMLASIERKVRALEATDGKTRYVWVDMFAASQNLLAGRFLPKDEAACSALKREHFAEYAACKEDTDHIFDGALAAVDELLLYCSPLTGKWLAPKHAFLLPDRGDEPPVGWTRTGPGAMTRAWCMFELASALARGCSLHVVLSPSDVDGFEALLTQRFGEIASLIAGLDAKDAQVSKTDDREYILGQVAKLEGGLGGVTTSVCASLREWLAEEGRALLGRCEAEGRRRDTKLVSRLGRLLQDQGKLFEAEPFRREAYAACRDSLGERHEDTLDALASLAGLLKVQGKRAEAEALYLQVLAGQREIFGDRHKTTLATISNLGSAFQDQGKLDEAEPFLCESLAARREMLGNVHKETLVSISKMGLLLKDKGRLLEAEALYREALTARRATLGDRHPSTLVSMSTLGGCLRDQGKLDDAEPLLREALATARETLGMDHRTTLRAAGRLSDVYRLRGDLTKAREQLHGVVAASRAARGDQAEITLILEGTEALQDLAERGDSAPLRAAIDHMRSSLGGDHHITLRYQRALRHNLRFSHRTCGSRFCGKVQAWLCRTS